MKCYDRFKDAIGRFKDAIGRLKDAIGRAYSRYGQFVARHPWKIIIGVVLMNGLLGIGMIRMESDINVSRVYAPMTSQATDDEEKVTNIFPDKSGDSYYGYQTVLAPLSAEILFKPNGGNILDINFLSKAEELVEQVKNLTADHDGTQVKLTDICAINRKSHVIDGDIFFTPKFQTAVTSSNVDYPIFTRSTGEPVDLVGIVAGEEFTGGTLTKATYMSVQFNLRSDSDNATEKARAWQEKFIDFMEEFTSDTFDFAFSHDDSLSEELNTIIGGDISLFSVTFILMITYVCVATYAASNDCVGNRMFLGFAGVMAAGLGIVASFGLVSACGMKFVSTMGIAPFFLLGMGVDAMFTLLSGLARASFGDGVTTGKRIGDMMKTSGVAITITSFTHIIAFAAGATSTFKSVRNFCVYTGVAVIFAFINQMTFFTACIAVHEDRTRASRHFICCCREAQSKEDMRKENQSSLSVFCCGGKTPQKPEDIESIFEKLLRKFFSKDHPLPVKIIILFVFAGCLVVAIWGLLNLKQGLVIRDLVNEDSYFYKYTEWSDANFEARLPISFVIDSRVEYSKPDIQAKIKSILDRAENDEFISTNSSISWLDAYVSSSHYVNTTETAFVTALCDHFLKDPIFNRFENDVKLDGDTIVASRMYVFIKTIPDSQDNGKMMLNMRDIASATPSPLSVTAFNPTFVIYEQNVSILLQTVQTLGVSLAVVFLITAIFMPHPLLLVYAFLTVAMIITGIIGFMHHWGLTLSSVTMINLIISVGFSVDLIVHICHAFMSANGQKNERVGKALRFSEGPILNGAVSSIIDIVMLSIANSYIFKSFFQVMLLVMLFVLSHALIFLPSVLFCIGPVKSSSDDKKSEPSEIVEANDIPKYKLSPMSSRVSVRGDDEDNMANHVKQSNRHAQPNGTAKIPKENGHIEQNGNSLTDTIKEKLQSDKNVTVIYDGKTVKTIEYKK